VGLFCLSLSSKWKIRSNLHFRTVILCRLVIDWYLHWNCRDHGLWLPTKSFSWDFKALHHTRRSPLTVFVQG
jgi:hypothetical protein